MNIQRNDPRALARLTAAMLIFGTIGIFRRALPVPSAMLACYRGFAGALFLLLAALIGKRRLHGSIPLKSAVLLIAAGAAMGLNWILLFEAYRYTTVATATLCYYMEPTFVILLSPLLFREKLTPVRGLCALISVIGMVLVSGVVEGGLPSAGEARGILLGLGAAVLYAFVVLTNKCLPGLDSFPRTMLELASAALALLPYVLLKEDFSAVSLTGKQIALLLIVGLVHTGLAYLLYFSCMDGLRAQTVALFSYIDPVSALLLSALLLGERLTVPGLIGAVLILGAAVLGELSPADKSAVSGKE